MDKYIADNSVDMIFSCPPYVDLEVYSDDPRDISNMEYEDFLKCYGEIIRKSCNKLQNNRFAVWVIGNVRGKDGTCRDFIQKTKQFFADGGMSLYNDMVLINKAGTAPIRAGKQFQSGRKVVNLHQNVLVFYKGNTKEIKNNFGEVEVMENDD